MSKTKFIGARCTPREKRKIQSAERATGLDESDFLRTATEEFFQNHKTREEQIAAVSRFRIAAAK